MNRDRRRRICRVEALEGRLCLSTFPGPGVASRVPPAIVAHSMGQGGMRSIGSRPLGHAQAAVSHAGRWVRPITLINRQYASFVNDYTAAANAALASSANNGSGTTTISQALTAPSASGSLVLAVSNASAFGVITSDTPLDVTVSINGVAQGTYIASGVVGNTLTLNEGPSADLPAGAIVQATIPVVDNTATLFPQYIVERVSQMTQAIVTYFNRIPIRLPKNPAPNRTPAQRNEIQLFVAQTLQGQTGSSLAASLLALPLPATSPSALNLYVQTFTTVIQQNQMTLTEGIRVLFAGQALAVPDPVIPAGTS